MFFFFCYLLWFNRPYHQMVVVYVILGNPKSCLSVVMSANFGASIPTARTLLQIHGHAFTAKIFECFTAAINIDMHTQKIIKITSILLVNAPLVALHSYSLSLQSNIFSNLSYQNIWSTNVTKYIELWSDCPDCVMQTKLVMTGEVSWNLNQNPLQEKLDLIEHCFFIYV